jgi:formylglycine-generating enzyme
MRARGIVCIGTLVGALACAPPATGPPSEPRVSSHRPRIEAAKCDHTGGVVDLLIVGWNPTSRSQLKAALGAGIVAVRYRTEGCKVSLELLPRCVGTPEYQYSPFWSAKAHNEIVRDAEELSVKLPLGAERVSGKVGGGRALRTDSLVVGVGAVPDDAQVRLHGADCERATHVVRKFYLGGFAMVAGASRALEGGGTSFGPGNFGQTKQTEQLSREGEPAACQQAVERGENVLGCSVPLSIRLWPLERVVWDACPQGAGSDGSQCARGAAAGKATANGSLQPGATVVKRMARIPAGTFAMGANAGKRPVRDVTVNSFELDVDEVTVAEYEQCVRGGKCDPALTGWTCNSGVTGREQHPVNCVDPEQAKAYCAWHGKRLPTEEEWEYAARGTDGRTYPWGNAVPSSQLCWNGVANSRGGWGHHKSTCPVGSYPSGDSPFGLHDMSGNVAELVTTNDPRLIHSYARGGGWRDTVARDVAATHGDFEIIENVGFRCARSR